MRTLIISAITCLLMASCQTNEVGRYQFHNGADWVFVLDTKEGIIYYSVDGDRRYNMITGERAILIKRNGSEEGYWKITEKAITEEREVLEYKP